MTDYDSDQRIKELGEKERFDFFNEVFGLLHNSTTYVFLSVSVCVCGLKIKKGNKLKHGHNPNVAAVPAKGSQVLLRHRPLQQ